ncbi:MAG: AfsR/SARP family transcriptional regulator [Gaiellaceae bacterium]
MTARARFARRVGAVLAVTVLLLLLALAWDLRPSLPPLPRSLSQPLPGGTISGVLDLAAWAVAVLLDLVLLTKVIQFGLLRTPSRTELRLRRAFTLRERAPLARSRDWRAHAAPLALPVLRLPARGESEPTPVRTDALQHELREPPRPVEAASDARDERPGVLLLGPLELTGCKKKHPRRQATTELIGYLAVQQRPVGRDELLEALWPGEDPRRSAARFYQAASEARKLLGPGFRRERETYSLDRTHVTVDLDELDTLQNEVAANEGDAQRVVLEQALELFRGEPLAGTGALWAESEQRRLTAVRADFLGRVARLHLTSGDAAGALRLAEEAAALDGSNERPVQIAMEAEAALGLREAVTERYERLRRDLDERFGLEPERETRSLYRELLGQS